MNVFFRVDSSPKIGLGHLMRCLTLGEALVDKGVKVSFICRGLQDDIRELVEGKGIKTQELPDRSTASAAADAEDTKRIILRETPRPDWLVVDNYGLDKSWESPMRAVVKNIMVIDDLADRSHDCDVLLDQNYFENLENRYDGLIPDNCAKYLGPKYVLLRKEFVKTEKSARERDDRVRRVMISFGGADPTNETAKALGAIKRLGKPDFAIDVVVGALNPNRKEVETLCAMIPEAVIYYQTNKIAQIMAAADIAIGSGGATTWERCFLGLPTITLVLAENQAKVAEDLDGRNIIINLGWYNKITEDDLALAVKNLIADPGKRRVMSLAGRRLVDGKGVERIISAIGGRQ
ncbi:UDP-2,4-diacetamido-2,4,6-trideoxy-beta-L-altropyranose hydrolase [Candidatus Saganbacteria bacterium]|nr:UDP-2,4-diacetamido-2,4,6-trideoxy-beta-L-altropyranose hydrolase [Candidatus Saganbacteria bacterium]